MGYQQLGDLTGSSKSQVWNIVKRLAEWEYLNIHHASRSCGSPILQQTWARMEQLIDDNPQMPLQKVATKYSPTISHTTIKNVANSAEDPLILLHTQKKPWFRPTSAQKRLLLAHSCHDQKEDVWEHVGFQDKTIYVLTPNPTRYYVCIRQSQLIRPVLSTKLLSPTFQSGHTPVPVWAAVEYGFMS